MPVHGARQGDRFVHPVDFEDGGRRHSPVTLLTKDELDSRRRDIKKTARTDAVCSSGVARLQLESGASVFPVARVEFKELHPFS